MTAPEPVDLQPLWTRGLKLLMPHVSRSTLMQIVQRTTLHLEGSRYDEAVAWRYAQGGCLELHVAPCVLSWYEPEQDELMLFAAAMTYLYFEADQGSTRNVWSRHSVSDDRLALCRLVGCAPTACDSPSERWRLLAAMGCISREQVEAVRPRFPTECRVCHSFVNSDEPRSDSHSICRSYLRGVVIPQLTATLQAEKLRAAGALDK